MAVTDLMDCTVIYGYKSRVHGCLPGYRIQMVGENLEIPQSAILPANEVVGEGQRRAGV